MSAIKRLRLWRNPLSVLVMTACASMSATAQTVPATYGIDNKDVPPHCLPQADSDPDWASAEIRQEKWYQNWKLSTTTYCVNPMNLERDNAKNGQFQKTVLRTDHRWLFRGDVSTNVARIFTVGLIPNEPDSAAASEDWSPPLLLTPGSNHQSALTSTSYRPGVAMVFGAAAEGDREPAAYVLDPPGGVDVNGSYGMSAGAVWEEVAMLGGIQTGYIRGAYLNEVPGSTFPSGYKDNINYHRYQPLPENQQEIMVTTTGNQFADIILKVDGQFHEDGIYRLPDQMSAKIEAYDKAGHPLHVRWRVYDMDKWLTSATCLMVSPSMQANRRIVISASESYADTPQLQGCSSFQKTSLQDTEFVAGPALAGNTRQALNGKYGAWTAGNVTLVSESLAALSDRRKLLNTAAQAIDLHDYRSSKYGPGSPGYIEQDFRSDSLASNSGRWNQIAFRLGNNPQTWCTDARNGYPDTRYAGDQRVRVSIIDKGSLQVVADKEFNIGVAQKKPASSGWMDPQWHTVSLAFKPTGADQDYTIRFESTSETGKACGALIAGLDFSADSAR
ncbi:scabin-related ADP-ribosyltransferase [Pantoea cypripedii]|uniref:Pierisin-like domain-containing protein n=1 Tax=Pantoea cypripedii TaxID=55209 RepID=A0A6B9G5R3_PANCY|nr:hypothetical protein [Pantoea cypripedii]QGY32152.1 hypothetical protein CUN67_24475 [Pantoea cypripedii]